MLTYSLVIPTLRRPDQLTRVLDCVRRVHPSPLEVLVVDGDPDSSAGPVVSEFAGRGLPVRHLTSPLGLTRQRNLGLDAAAGDIAVFLDDDAEPAPDAPLALLRAYEDPSVVGATGRVIQPANHRRGDQSSRLRTLLNPTGREGTMTAAGYPRRLVHLDRPHRVEFMHGCVMSARTELARTVRFDERLPGYGLAEDEDFGYRLSRQGEVRYVPEACVNHLNAGFSTRDSRAFTRTVVVHRRYLFRKNFPQTPRARLQFVLLLAVLAAHRLVNRDLDGVRGLLDGVKAVRRGATPDAANG